MNRNIYIDCTQLILTQLNTGIQRVERNILKHSLDAQAKLNINIQPVVYFRGKFYKVKSNAGNDNLHSYLLNIMLHLVKPNKFRLLAISVFPCFKKSINQHWKEFNRILLFFPLLIPMLPIIASALLLFFINQFKEVEFRENDIYFLPGAWWHKEFDLSSVKKTKKMGCLFVVLIHDIIPITHSRFFNPEHAQAFERIFVPVCELADLLVANSAYTSSELNHYFEKVGLRGDRKKITHFKLGFDLDLIANNERAIRNNLKDIFHKNRPYISVGTVEPRKNYPFLLDVFDQLWLQGKNTSLCIIGKYGWKADDLVSRIRSHERYNVNLFWFEDLQDTELEFCYQNAKALIYPSIIEGFGLPLVESLSHGCSVMASDIPVFHEIGGDRCAYFSLDSTNQLCELILQFEASGKLPNVVRGISIFKWNSWQESTEELFSIILENLRK